MSASLVGSEMCIRHRASTALANWPGPGPDHTPWARRCPPSRGRWAVSYTHLTLPTICSV
eukprot:7821043-Alexandrium_andersonii.AAC.1